MASLEPSAGIDVYADHKQRVIFSGFALIILPSCFVILRLVSRIIANAGLWWDDCLVVLALFLSYGPNIAMIICKSITQITPTRTERQSLILSTAARTNGFGKHLWALPDPEHNTSQFLKILYIYIIIYYSAVTAIKLAMYEL